MKTARKKIGKINKRIHFYANCKK